MARHRFSQKTNKRIWFFLPWQESGNTFNLKFRFQVSSISGLSYGKKSNSFVRFLGESMGLQSAFGFIWPLLKTNSIQLTVLINAVKSFCSYMGSTYERLPYGLYDRTYLEYWFWYLNAVKRSTVPHSIDHKTRVYCLLW